jgi:hypothetical protein
MTCRKSDWPIVIAGTYVRCSGSIASTQTCPCQLRLLRAFLSLKLDGGTSDLIAVSVATPTLVPSGTPSETTKLTTFLQASDKTLTTPRFNRAIVPR